MIETRIDLLSAAIPTWLVATATLLTLALWLTLRALAPRLQTRVPRFVALAPQALVAVAWAWLLLQSLARVVTYACNWPLWVAALLLGLGVQVVAAAQQRERATLPRGLRVAILTLRAMAVTLCLLMLMQPTLVRMHARKISRRVAVLVDGSASMRFVDRQWQIHERLQWAIHAGKVQPKALEPGAAPPDDPAKIWGDMPVESQLAINRLCETTRLALADQLLTHSCMAAAGVPLLQQLERKYDVDLYLFARTLKRVTAASLLDDTSDDHFTSATDMAAALESVLKEIPSEQLAGALLLSDGLHNAESSLIPVARRYAAQQAPLCAIALGGSRLPFDVALADVSAPESLFLGDRARFVATIKATGAIGRKLNIRLTHGDAVVEERELDVSSEEWQREVRFTHEPQSRGIAHYELRVNALEGELFADNNAWRCDVAVSDDRINVLLVDQAPRWEFRYLRNLFFGRDKSVHLQSWLVQPDRVESLPATQLPPASAKRKFGDAEAGGWPVSREEWRAFDVIIIGDIDAQTLTQPIQEEIRACVVERGALLVLIGGARAMPHAFGAESILTTLSPFTAMDGAHDYWHAPERSFRLELTPAGQSHQIMAQSASLTENEDIWQTMPPFDWRLPVVAKTGAEILAVARVEADTRVRTVADVRQAVGQMEEILRDRAHHAVIAVQRVGRGKVLGLAFDQTWRLRYRIGDARHHRFWGQVLRWGLGERMRAGAEHFRIGTDKIVYAPDEPVNVLARVLDDHYAGIDGAHLEATLSTIDGRELTTVRMQPRVESYGIYEALLPAQTTPGACKLRVQRVDTDTETSAETEFMVSGARRPVEMGEVRPNRDTLYALAKATGGRVVTPDAAELLPDAFGDGRSTLRERRELALWCSPWTLLLLATLLTAEWLLRKKGGLI